MIQINTKQISISYDTYTCETLQENTHVTSVLFSQVELPVQREHA